MERTRKKYHYPADLKQDLLDKAIEIVRNEGVDGLTLKNLASSLGVTSAAMYHHYPDKTALLVAIIDRRLTELTALLKEKAFGLQEDVESFLLKTAMVFYSFCEENPEYVVLMSSDLTRNLGTANPKLRDSLAEMQEPILKAIERGQETGIFRKGAKEILAIMFVAPIIGFAMVKIKAKSVLNLKEFTSEELKPYFFELVCNAFMAVKVNANKEAVKSQLKVFEKG